MNEKNIVLQKLHILNLLYLKEPSEEILFKMESLLIAYLKSYPKDTDMWLKLTMVEFTPPWEDYDRIKGYINAVIAYDKYNIESLLILAYAQYIFRGEIKEDLFTLLMNARHTLIGQKLISMAYLVAAWYYKPIDEKEYEKKLLKSIYYCDEYVKNYVLLGELYCDRGNIVEGRKMIQLGLKNIQKIYTKGDFTDITDINEFFDEFFKGTHIISENLQSIKKLLEN